MHLQKHRFTLTIFVLIGLFFVLYSSAESVPIKSIDTSVDAFLFQSNVAKDTIGDEENGRKLFKANCAACHALNREASGPALKGITERAPSKKWIAEFIRNSDSLIQSGDAYAQKIYDEYGQEPMTHFPTLTDQEIDDILAYIEKEK